MPLPFEEFTTEQKTRFAALVKRWNLEPADVVKHIDTSQIAPRTIVSADPAVSHIKTKPFNIQSVQHMKEMVGFPDHLYTSRRMSDRSVVYPASLPRQRFALLGEAPNFCWLKDQLTEEEHHTLKAAWLAYVVGDSRKISPEMVSMINAIHFPATVAVAAAENITVKPGTTYIFGNPSNPTLQAFVVGALVIESGGAIGFAVPANITGISCSAQVPAASVQASLGDEPDANSTNIQIYSPAPAAPATPPAQGARGKETNATKGVTTTSTGKNPSTTCTTASQAAVAGDIGYGGTPGTAGQGGVAPPPVVTTFDSMTGNYVFLAGGGNGADGGVGGQGGQGGTGGDGAVANSPCGNQGPGKGGLGGVGGVGGAPGNAAPGSISYFYYKALVQPFSYSVKTVGGLGGSPGLGGLPGGGGAGGADPAGVMGAGYNPAAFTNGSGQRGATGNNGNPGNNAPAGQIFLQQAAS